MPDGPSSSAHQWAKQQRALRDQAATAHRGVEGGACGEPGAQPAQGKEDEEEIGDEELQSGGEQGRRCETLQRAQEVKILGMVDCLGAGERARRCKASTSHLVHGILHPRQGAALSLAAVDAAA